MGGSPMEFRYRRSSRPTVERCRPIRLAIPETREYRMRFWDRGEPNGDWTAVTKVRV